MWVCWWVALLHSAGLSVPLSGVLCRLWLPDDSRTEGESLRLLLDTLSSPYIERAWWFNPMRDLTRDQCRYAPSQWERTLYCNSVSHWLGTFFDWSLPYWMGHVACMMTLWHENAFFITGLLWGESTNGFPSQMVSIMELWLFSLLLLLKKR